MQLTSQQIEQAEQRERQLWLDLNNLTCDDGRDGTEVCVPYCGEWEDADAA